ncbi:Hypothetical protein CINCED_3A012498 [Cinara cedri]|uniref:Winged helix-turn-helix DNA-binding domain n=1 Tax=Cinara cedri TaxID=506608 RepID=A0A5E4M2L9_9HEMI|nr:Hypothetical protein CINCED_3A012498 [Cinara cedri]
MCQNLTTVRSLGKNTVGAKSWLGEVSRDCIRKGECSGCPKEAVTDENIKKVHRIILNNREVKLIEIADIVKISSGHVHHIIHEYLYMRNLCAKWVPRELTIDQKQQRVNDSEQCLKLFNRNKPELLRQYVTMDETLAPYFTPGSN